MALPDRLADFHTELDCSGTNLRQNVGIATVRISNFPAEEPRFGLRAAFLRMTVSVSAGHRRFVRAHNFVRRAVSANVTTIYPHDAVTQPPGLVELVAHQHYRAPRSRHVAHLS